MTLVPFRDMMFEAQGGRYAVGCFDAWNLDSLTAIADAAEKLNAPVVVCVNEDRGSLSTTSVHDERSHFAPISIDICRELTVPVCMMFSDSVHLNTIHSALDLGFNLVKFCGPQMVNDLQLQVIGGLAGWAHYVGAAVEAELPSRHCISCAAHRDDALLPFPMTDFRKAKEFIEQTGIDALAIDIGQSRRFNGRKAYLNLSRLAELEQLPVPLVLRDASNVERRDLRAAVKQGIRMVNFGPALQQVYLNTMRAAGAEFTNGGSSCDAANPRLESNALPVARLAMQQLVEEFIQLVGSAGKATETETSLPSISRHGEPRRQAILLSWQAC